MRVFAVLAAWLAALAVAASSPTLAPVNNLSVELQSDPQMVAGSVDNRLQLLLLPTLGGEPTSLANASVVALTLPEGFSFDRTAVLTTPPTTQPTSHCRREPPILFASRLCARASPPSERGL